MDIHFFITANEVGLSRNFHWKDELSVMGSVIKSSFPFIRAAYDHFYDTRAFLSMESNRFAIVV